MKPFTLRTLLLALCVLTGLCVSAQSTTLYEKEAGAWTSSDIEDWPGDNATVSVNAEGNLYFTASNTSYENKKSISFSENSIITLNMTWNVGQSTGRPGGYNYIKIGGVEIRSYGQDQYGAILFDGVQASVFGKKDDVRGGEWTIQLTIDQASGSCEYSINMSSSGEVTGTGVTQGTPNGVAIGFFKPGRVGDIYQTIKSISVSEEKQNVQTASYTVNFQTTDNILLASETRSGVVGKGIVLTPTDRSDRWKDDVKYLYLDDDADGQVINANGSTVVTVYFKEAVQDAYMVTAVDGDGNELQQLARGVLYEGEKTVVYYRKGIKVNDVWYLTEQRTSGSYYGVTVEGGDDVTVTYAPSELDDFIEIEDLIPSRSWATTGSVPDRYSNGLAPRLQKQSYVATAPLPAGIYTVSLRGRDQSSSQTATLPLHLVDASGNLATSPSATFDEWAGGQQAEMTVEGVVVPEGYALALYNATEWNSNLEMDYLTLKRTGNPEVAEYTVKFVDENGNDLKDPEVRSNSVGVAISLASTDKAPITISRLVDDSGDEPVYEDVTYIYVSDDSEGKVVADGVVVTIKFREAQDVPFTLTAIDSEGNELGVVAEGAIKETLSQVVYYTKAVEKDGKWYAIEQNATDPYYGITIASGENPTLTYQEADYDYFSEIEDLTPSHSWAANGAFPSRYANGQARRLYKNSYVKTAALPAGKYTVTLRARNGSRNDATVSVGIASGSLPSIIGELDVWGNSAQAERTIEGVNVPEGFSVAIVNTDPDNNNNLELDYIYLKRTGDYEALLGDANGDGQINVTDVSTIVSYCLTNKEPSTFIKANADTTRDGEITISDVTVVVNMILSGI